MDTRAARHNRAGTAAADKPSVRLGGLDAVRIAAAMMVFLTHVPGRLGLLSGPPIEALVWAGNGVALFFALSGYLLWRPFVTGRPDLRTYLASRAGRILPAYWLACLVLTMLRGGDFLHFAVMDPDQTPKPLGVLWTLQAEVMFYAALPLLGLLRRPLLVPIVLGIGSLALELNLGAARGSGLESLLPIRFWAFTPGMILAAWQPRTDWRWLAGGLVAMTVGAATLELWGGQWADVPSTLGAALLVGWGFRAEPRGRRLWAAGAAISYGIYL